MSARKRGPSEVPNVRVLIDSVIQDFSEALAQTRGKPRLSPDEQAIYESAKELFVCAGAARLVHEHSPRRWLQMNVRFTSERQQAAFLDQDLAAHIERWLARGLISNASFTCKRPGVRLRVCGTEIDTTVRPLIEAHLSSLKRRRRLAGFEVGAYEGETYQFGGETGLELFHDFSTFDSLTAIRFHHLQHQKTNVADGSIMSLLLLNTLIDKFAGDPCEAWDIWSNMRLTHRNLAANKRSVAQAALDSQREIVEPIVRTPHKIAAQLSRQERALIRSYGRSCEEFAVRLSAAANQGKLLFGVRQLLPFYIIFHWNRMMLDIDAQLRLTYFMQTLLNPKGE